MTNSGADIQPDKKWAKVHNAILELLAQADISGGELRCLLFVLRVTYGCHRKEYAMSYSLIAKGTHLDRRSVRTIMHELHLKNMITIGETKLGRKGSKTYGFNKYFEQWIGVFKDDSPTFLNGDQLIPISEPIGDQLIPNSGLNEDQLIPNSGLNEDQLIPNSGLNEGQKSPISEPIFALNGDQLIPKSGDQLIPILEMALKDNKDRKKYRDHSLAANDTPSALPTAPAALPATSISPPSKPKRTKKARAADPPKKEKAPRVPTPANLLFEALCWAIHGHTNTRDGLTEKLRGALNGELKRFEAMGARAEDIHDWYAQKWVKEWPGNGPDNPRPKMGQVVSGMAAWMENHDHDDAPAVLPFSMADLLK